MRVFNIAPIFIITNPTRSHINNILFLGGTIVVCNGDGSVRCWDGENGLLLSEHFIREPDRATPAVPVDAVAIAPDGNRFAAADRLGVVQLWDVRFNNKKPILTKNGYIGDRLKLSHLSSLAITNDGYVFFSKYLDKSSGVFRFGDNANIERLGDETHARARFFSRSVAVAPDSKTVAEAGIYFSSREDIGTFAVRLWEIPSRRLRSVLELKEERVVKRVSEANIAAFSPSGAMLASRELGGIGLWDVRKLKLSKYLELNDSVSAVAFGRDSRFLTVGVRSSVFLFDVGGGRALGRFEIVPKNNQLMAVPAKIRAIAISPDNKIMAILSEHKEIQCFAINVMLRILEKREGMTESRFAKDSPELSCDSIAASSK